jgi:hypothetical protein
MKILKRNQQHLDEDFVYLVTFYSSDKAVRFFISG